MKNKYVFVLVMLVCIFAVSVGMTTLYVNHTQQPEQQKDITIVTSFYPMYIAAMNVVGDTEGVTLVNLSEPQTGCLHDFQLTPADMKVLSGADVFIVNGGGIESFMEQVASAYPQLAVVEASEGIALLGEEGDAHEEDIYADDGHEEHDHDHDVNAHAWMSIADYRMQIENIASALEQLDPVNAKSYHTNAKSYDEKLAGLQDKQQKLAQQINGGNVILFHEAYAYVAQELGLQAVYVLNLDEERQVSAGEISDVLAGIREGNVSYILAEELYGKSMGDTVEAESDVKVLYIDPLTRGDYDADSYLEGMQRNLEILEQLASSGFH